MHLLVAHPFGAGFSSSAFRHYMVIEYPSTSVEKTHCGWLDFSLGVGLPGLFLTLSAIFLVLKKAILHINYLTNNSHLYIIIFFLIGMCFFWMVGEVSEREFIEHFFFFIALSSSYLSHIKLRQKNISFHTQ